MDISSKVSQRIWVKSELVFDYHLVPSAKEGSHSGVIANNRLIILLHGYSETGERILNKLASALPEGATVLAPNGPFPTPYKTPSGYRVSFGWYFYDPVTREYFIDMSIAVSGLKQAVQALGFSDSSKTIIGFSQGGYLAPFVAHALGGTEQVVGLGCEYLVDEFPPGLQFRIDGIHGQSDEIIPVNDAAQSHARLKERGIEGDFHIIDGQGHSIEEAMVEKLKVVLKN